MKKIIFLFFAVMMMKSAYSQNDINKYLGIYEFIFGEEIWSSKDTYGYLTIGTNCDSTHIKLFGLHPLTSYYQTITINNDSLVAPTQVGMFGMGRILLFILM